MKKTKYLFVPVLVALVVLVVSLYPTEITTREASAAPRAAVVTKYLMLPAAAFNVTEDGKDYINNGGSVKVERGSGEFVAPVYLPAGARIKMIKLFAKDVNTNYDLCATLFEIHPKSALRQQIKQVCTTGSSVVIQQPIKYISHYVKWYYGYYIWLEFPASTDLWSTAVMIKYTVIQ
jgi:hypothetical protein